MEIDLEMQTQQLLNIYVERYEQKYKTKPILNNAVDQTVCKDIIRAVGFSKAVSMVKHYFKVNHDWFQKKGHSLDVLKSNLNIVNQSLPKESLKESPKGIPIQTLLSCDSCFKHFNYQVNTNDLDELRYCEACLKKEKSQRLPNQFAANSAKMKAWSIEHMSKELALLKKLDN